MVIDMAGIVELFYNLIPRCENLVQYYVAPIGQQTSVINGCDHDYG